MRLLGVRGGAGKGEGLVDCGMGAGNGGVGLGGGDSLGQHRLAQPRDRVLGLQRGDLALGTIDFGITLEMAVEAVGLDLDQGRTLAAASPRHRLAGDIEELRRVAVGSAALDPGATDADPDQGGRASAPTGSVPFE